MNANFAAPPAILLLGDSITQYADRPDGFATIMRDFYQGKYSVLNLGISGLNSRQYLQFINSAAFEQVLPSDLLLVRFVVYGIGANDAADTSAKVEEVSEAFLQHVELDEYIVNLRRARERLGRLFPSAKVLFLLPPPNSGRSTRTPALTAQYARACANVAGEFGDVSVDPRDGWNDSMLLDGLHLNSDGNKHMADQLIAQIGEGEFWRLNWRDWK